MQLQPRRLREAVPFTALALSLMWPLFGCTQPQAETRPDAAAAPAPPYTGSFTKPSDEELRARLTPLQYSVTQKSDTEAPFRNEHWDTHQAGIYVDIVSGEPLFSSQDKFDSGTGWPSFTRPLEEANIVKHEDGQFGMVRTEVRSKQADSHLGHVFDDGPAPTHLRYCINSASLRFVPVEKLEESGYGKYRSAFGGAGAPGH